MERKKTVKFLWWFAFGFLFAGGLFSLVFSVGGYLRVRSWVNAFTPDGNFEAFTEYLYTFLRPWLGGGVLLLLLAAGGWGYYRPITRSWVAAFLQFWEVFWGDTKAALRWLKSELQAGGWLLFSFAFSGLLLRVLLVNRPMGHDEAYTYMAFSQRGLWVSLTDYHLPNNHIFHTALVFFATRLLGDPPWVVRLPAMLTSWSMIPLVYLTAGRYFNRNAGVLVAGMVAVFPVFLHFSSAARGYAGVAWFALAMWLLAQIVSQKNNRLAWFLLVLFGALGIYTIPIMVYPIGMVFGWLSICWLVGDTAKEYTLWGFLGRLVGTGLLLVALALFLYSPVFIYTGWDAVFGNDVVSNMRDPSLRLFIENLAARLSNSWLQWHLGFPGVVAWITLVFAGWALFWFRKLSRIGIDFLLVSLPVLAVGLLMQQSVAWVRVWFFLAPFYFSYVSSGFVNLWTVLKKLWEEPPFAPFVLGLVGIFSIGTLFWVQSIQGDQGWLFTKPSAVERTAQFVAQQVGERDIVLAIAPDAPALWYYAYRLGVGAEQFRFADELPQRVFVVINTVHEQSIEDVLLMKSDGMDWLDLKSAELLHQDGADEVYMLETVAP